MHKRLEENSPQTNNFVEVWHRRFRSNIGDHHLNLWNFIDILKREETLNELKTETSWTTGVE